MDEPAPQAPPAREVYRHRLTIPADAPAGWYVLAPELELAILELSGTTGVWCNAAVPVAVQPGTFWRWQVPAGTTEVRLDSAAPKLLRLLDADGPRDRLLR